jgi:hypothetical protein
MHLRQNQFSLNGDYAIFSALMSDRPNRPATGAWKITDSAIDFYQGLPTIVNADQK